MKKAIACILALAIATGAVLLNLPSPTDVITPMRVVAAPTPREGYILEPTLQGISGVDTTSAFILTSQNADTPSITIDGQPAPTIEHTGANTFLITPAAELSPNSLYIFRLERSGLSDITWTFQTTVRFEIISTLPANQGVNVPVDTGIEITFSATIPDISDYFSITPQAEGRFITRGNTTVFMPLSPLAAQQLYTVTIRAGVALEGTNEALAEDYVFSFETASANRNDPHTNEFIRFFTRYAEFPSFEPAQINFHRDTGNWEDAQPPAAQFSAYRIDSREDAFEAVRQLTNAPRWAIFAMQNSLVNTTGLTRILNFESTEHMGDQWHETLTLPEVLPPGFYLIQGTVGEMHDQVLIQISDLAVQVVADDSQALLWVNDMTTGQPATGAVIRDNIADTTYVIDDYGIAMVTRQLEREDDLLITAANGKEISLFLMAGGTGRHSWWGGTAVDENYWTVLQLDRNLFQRDDTLYFWGFAQSRDNTADIRHLTTTLTTGWRWDQSTRDVLHRQTVTAQNGVYFGEIALPNLDQGSYELTIRHGSTIVGAITFVVQDFVKPPYQMLLSSDRQAVFAGEEVIFTARTEFFEGTPVPELSINYDFWGWGVNHMDGGRGVTDADGNFTISVRPQAESSETQGRVGLTFTAEATLPEVGWTHRTTSVDVFVNDINVNAQARRDGTAASLTVNVHNITLDRINNGTAEHWHDILDTPVAGQVLDAVIYRTYWVPIRDGERYCFIDRRVVPRYRYDRREEIIDRFQITTDTTGEAHREFTLPAEVDGRFESFHARITTTDGNGRNMTEGAFIGHDFDEFFWRAGSGEIFLHNPRNWDETYDIGDPVELTVMQGTEAVEGGSFLFVVMQNGIINYQVGPTNPFVFDFSEEHVPNAVVHVHFFNGHTYHAGFNMTQHLRFDSQTRRLQIHVDADQDAYRPGDMSSLSFSVTDMDGNPRAANINVSVVDEALFALRNYQPDTLMSLYQQIGDGLRFSMATHRLFASDGIHWGDSDYMARATDMAADEPEAAAQDPAGGANEPHLREIFEDTAIFASQRTNVSGRADISFRLPDNITSWRVTVSAISDDLYAGNTVTNIIVTNPMFVHYALGSTFLVGDVPTIGVNAFGTGLQGGETINFEVWPEDAPTDIRRASGSAFERVNIPLWEMTDEGTNALIIRASVQGNASLSDALRHEYRVIQTHRLVDTATFYEVDPSTVFSLGSGLTNITFTDRGRGQFMRDLVGMLHISGVRLEGLVAHRQADKLVTAHFPDAMLGGQGQNFDPRDYQRPDGGLAMLPYAESDLATTIRLMPFLLDDISVPALRNYLRNTFENGGTDNRILALYGLAMLHEPVLLDLQAFAQVDDLPVWDVAYLALGFAALGETVVANYMYMERILPHLQRVEPWYRVNTGRGGDSILEATSAVALLAATLEMPQRLPLHQYAARHRTCDLLITIERLAFITHEIDRHSATPASITYRVFGEETTRDLTGWRSHTLRIPVENMNQFELVRITGEVGAVSISRTHLEEAEIIDNDIVVNRRFLREGGREVTDSFQQDEVVRVEISIDYSAVALQGSYLVTDFLPAGLQFVPGSARFRSPRTGGSHWAHAVMDGQRVMFFDFNTRFDGVRVYYYYARVISPGTFIAEGTIVQNIGARGYLTVGEDAVIRVND